MRTGVIAGVGAVVLCAAACGTSGSGGSPSAGSPSSAGAGGGVAGKSAEEIFKAASAAMAHAKSVRMKGNFIEDGKPFSMNMRLAQGAQARGTMSGPFAKGKVVSFELASTGGKFYMLSATLWGAVGGAAAQRMFGNRWVVMPIGSKDAADFRQFADLTTMSQAMLKDTGTLAKSGTATIDGHKAIGLRADDGSVTYVAATGEPYVLRVVMKPGGKQHLDFVDWNKPFTVTAPAGAIDISKLKGA